MKKIVATIIVALTMVVIVVARCTKVGKLKPEEMVNKAFPY